MLKLPNRPPSSAARSRATRQSPCSAQRTRCRSHGASKPTAGAGLVPARPPALQVLPGSGQPRWRGRHGPYGHIPQAPRAPPLPGRSLGQRRPAAASALARSPPALSLPARRGRAHTVCAGRPRSSHVAVAFAHVGRHSQRWPSLPTSAAPAKAMRPSLSPTPAVPVPAAWPPHSTHLPPQQHLPSHPTPATPSAAPPTPPPAPAQTSPAHAPAHPHACTGKTSHAPRDR